MMQQFYSLKQTADGRWAIWWAGQAILIFASMGDALRAARAATELLQRPGSATAQRSPAFAEHPAPPQTGAERTTAATGRRCPAN